MLLKWVLAALCGVLLTGTTAALAAAPTGDELAKAKFEARHSGGGSGVGTGDVPRTKNFRVLGHHDLGLSESNADVLVHGNFAYVGHLAQSRAPAAASRSLTSATYPIRS